MKFPKISIIMSCFNSALYLRSAVDSMLNQSFSDFEFIIVNDGSTDETLKILNEYTDNRICIVNQENQGLASSLNKAIALAKGEYLVRMDSDDISHPNRLEKQVKFMESNPSIGVMGTAVNYINEEGNILGRSFPTLKSNSIKKKILECQGNVINHPSVIIRKNIITLLGSYNSYMSFNQDYQLWSKLLRNGVYIVNINDVLLNYRISINSIGSEIVFSKASKEILHKILGYDNPSEKMVKELKDSIKKNKGITSREKAYLNLENKIYNIIKYFIGSKNSSFIVSKIKNIIY